LLRKLLMPRQSTRSFKLPKKNSSFSMR
jgi:hypothetical protein